LRFFAWDPTHELFESWFQVVHCASPSKVVLIAVVGSFSINFELITIPEKELASRINDPDILGSLTLEEVHRSFLPL
jgi:hypothetical protein